MFVNKINDVYKIVGASALNRRRLWIYERILNELLYINIMYGAWQV